MCMTPVSISCQEKDHFAKWLLGWRAGGGPCCGDIPEKVWAIGRTLKPEGCSWQAYGQIMAKLRLVYIDVDVVLWRYDCAESKH